ncbi:MAG: AhpC/TSA family protein [Deltaproteobacteria bacterium]|nr:AhpC/TSA family protein [Deltaproteobacteria bacterium]
MAELRPRIPELRALGADVVVVGNGWAAVARAFQERLEINDVPVVCDAKRDAYRLAGFRRSVWSVFNPVAGWFYVRAWFRGHRQGRMQGDAWQQGGTLVIQPGGAILYRFAARFAGDHAPLNAVFRALRPNREAV